MASIVVAGDTSGTVTLAAPAVSGTTTLTLPTTTGNVVADTATQTLTNKTLTSPTIATPTITGQATIPTINLTGGQITFPATQSASADANTLDDYEEGTWTPTLTGSGGGSATYGAQSGTYVKVGSMVTLNFWIFGSSVSTLSGTVTITLPFAVTSVNAVRPSSIMLSASLTLTGQLGGWVNFGDTAFGLQSSNNGSKAALNATAIPASSFEIYGSFSYRASA